MYFPFLFVPAIVLASLKSMNGRYGPTYNFLNIFISKAVLRKRGKKLFCIVDVQNMVDVKYN